jgi:hypothetical protein
LYNFVYCWGCSHPEYVWHIYCWTSINKQSIVFYTYSWRSVLSVLYFTHTVEDQYFQYYIPSLGLHNVHSCIMHTLVSIMRIDFWKKSDNSKYQKWQKCDFRIRKRAKFIVLVYNAHPSAK